MGQKIQQKLNVEIKDKYLLTVQEANAYFNLGINKLYEIMNEPHDFIVMVGDKKKLINRKKFEQYIDNNLLI